MLRTIKNTVKNDRECAMERYEDLVNLFNFRPELETYLKIMPAIKN